MLHVQVKEPRLQARAEHSATAFTHTPALTEVVLFGGYPEWPEDVKVVADLPLIAKTTVLKFGESPSAHVSSIARKMGEIRREGTKHCHLRKEMV